MQLPNKLIRNRKNKHVEDQGNIQDVIYNEMAGAQKNLAIGPNLAPISDGAGGFTTSAVAIKALQLGSALAIYNNSGAVAAVRFSDDPAAAALASGAVHAGTGDVGIPCPPNAWTYLSNFDKRYVITQANLMVFQIKDSTRIIDQSISK